jgi:hypothetical protein
MTDQNLLIELNVQLLFQNGQIGLCSTMILGYFPFILNSVYVF